MTQQAREEEKKRMIALLRKEYGDDVWFGSTKCGVDSAYTKLIDIETVVDYLLSSGAIVLPCKVGDTVYKIGYTPCTKYGEDPYSSLCEDCMIPCDSHLTIVTHIAPTNAWIVSEFIDKAKQYQYYFLTRKAAERALKEREKHE